MSKITEYTSFISDAEKVSDEGMEARLHGHSVSDVTRILDLVIVDTSMGKQARRELVARVVKNQPHPTKGLEEYKKWNDDVFSPWWRNGPILFGAGGVIVESVLAIYSFQHGNFSTGIFTAVCALLVFSLSFVFAIIEVKSSSEVYGERFGMGIEQHREHTRTEEQQRIEREQQSLAERMKELSGGESSVSLMGTKEDFSQAKARIASYETDLDMALRYPAFNDISVPEVRDMVKQLRACSKMVDHVNYHNVSEFSDKVDELWMCIQSAEEAAKRIGLKSLDAEELRLLDKIKGLAAHAADATYSEEVRGNFYQQLRAAVGKLNEHRTVVPTKIVAEIEQKATLTLLTAETANEGNKEIERV